MICFLSISHINFKYPLPLQVIIPIKFLNCNLGENYLRNSRLSRRPTGLARLCLSRFGHHETDELEKWTLLKKCTETPHNTSKNVQHLHQNSHQQVLTKSHNPEPNIKSSHDVMFKTRFANWISTGRLHKKELFGEGTDAWKVQIGSRRLRAWGTWARANTQEAGLTHDAGMPGLCASVPGGKRRRWRGDGGGKMERGSRTGTEVSGLVAGLGLGFWD